MRRWLFPVIYAALAFLMAFFDMFGMAENMVEDTLYHTPGTVNDKIRIIKIDERTMERLGDFSEWDRSVYARLVETLCVSEDVRPEVIGFDLLLSGEKDPPTDRRFAQACAAHGNVVMGFNYVFSRELVSDTEHGLSIDPMSVQGKMLPYAALGEVTTQGFVNATLDSDDGVLRSAFLYFDEADGTRTWSFDAAVYERYMVANGMAPDYPVDTSVFRFRYSGGVGEYESVSLLDVLEGSVPAEAFDDCIVLVGAYAAGMMDAYFVPVDRGQQMYGVEIHANVIQGLMEGKTLTATPAWLDGLLAAAISAGLLWLCRERSAVGVLLLCGGTAAAKLGAGALVFHVGYTWNHLAVPVMAVFIAVFSVLHRYAQARRAKQRIERAFSKYVAPQVVNELAKSGAYELKLGGENRHIAVLFVDIRGFTPLSESLEPEQVVDILNGYLALTTRCIFRHGGTLDKFIGDATMAVFNAPFDTEDYVIKSLLAAWDIVQGGSKIEAEYLERYGKPVGFGVGLNCGPAVVGNIGCDFRMDYTAIGDTVNTAARLESQAPKGAIYISDAVYEAVRGRVAVTEVGELPLKGKSKGVFVYAVTDVYGYISPECMEESE